MSKSYDRRFPGEAHYGPLRPGDWREQRENLTRLIKAARGRIQQNEKRIVAARKTIARLEAKIKSITPPGTRSTEVQARQSERCFLAYRLRSQFEWSASQLAALFGVNVSSVHKMLRAGERLQQTRPWPGAGVVDQRQPNANAEPLESSK
jgi:hypothetical protein